MWMLLALHRDALNNPSLIEADTDHILSDIIRQGEIKCVEIVVSTPSVAQLNDVQHSNWFRCSGSEMLLPILWADLLKVVADKQGRA